MADPSKEARGPAGEDARAELLRLVELGLELEHACDRAGVAPKAVRADQALMGEVLAAYRRASAKFRERLVELALKRGDARMLATAVELRDIAIARAAGGKAPAEVHHPSARSMRGVRGVRRQLVLLFREGKAGLIPTDLLGKLTNCLNAIVALDNGQIVEQRMAEIEAKLAMVKPNGHDRTELRA